METTTIISIIAAYIIGLVVAVRHAAVPLLVRRGVAHQVLLLPRHRQVVQERRTRA